jgi:hypothetical protein
MRNHYHVVALIPLLPCLAVATGAAQNTTAPHKTAAAGSAEQQVRAVELHRFKALTGPDIAALDLILGDDLTYTHSDGHVDSKTSYLDAVGSGKLKYISIMPNELKIGQADFKSENNGKNETMKLRFTDAYVRRQGRWQLVAWESTRVPNP